MDKSQVEFLIRYLCDNDNMIYGDIWTEEEIRKCLADPDPFAKRIILGTAKMAEKGIGPE